MHHKKSIRPLLWVLLAIPVLWLAAILAYSYADDITLFTLLERATELMNHPFAVRWTEHTPKFLLGGMLVFSPFLRGPETNSPPRGCAGRQRCWADMAQSSFCNGKSVDRFRMRRAVRRRHGKVHYVCAPPV